MAVPYTFGSATTSIPLSQLDSNFATTITLGNTAIQLGNTVTTLNNMTLANVTITSGTSSFSSIANGTSNVTVNSSGGNITLGTAGTTAITIDTSQNVGIGTASPAQKLEVAGNVLLSNNQYLGVKDSTGAAVGFPIFTGSNDAIFGYLASGSTGISTYQFRTGNNTERMRIDSSGNVLIGTTSQLSNERLNVTTNGNTDAIIVRNSAATAGKLWKWYNDTTNTIYFRNQSNAGVYITDGGTSWTGTSDERVKDIIEPITNAAEKVSTLRAVIGKFKTDEEGTRRAFLIAQDVQTVLPEAVSVQDDEIGTLGIAYTDTIPLLVAAIKEQQALITSLTARIAALEAK
jgi:hypothetical protein